MNKLRSHQLQEDDQLDQIFSILSNSRRRDVLEVLNEAGGTVESLTTLTDYIAARENDTLPDQLTDRDRKTVYVSLKQTHIPALSEADAIRVDPESGSISLTDRSCDFGRLLDWSACTRRYGPYLFLSVGSSFFYLAVLGGAVSHEWITPFVAGIIIFLLFGALAAVEPYLSRGDQPMTTS